MAASFRKLFALAGITHEPQTAVSVKKWKRRVVDGKPVKAHPHMFRDTFPVEFVAGRRSHGRCADPLGPHQHPHNRTELRAMGQGSPSASGKTNYGSVETGFNVRYTDWTQGRVMSLTYSIRGQKDWWRRRELNPRPRKSAVQSLRVYPVLIFRRLPIKPARAEAA